MNFKISHVDHIGIAVKDLAESKKFYTEVLGLKVHGEDEVVEEQKVKVCFIPTGDSEIELLESTSPEGPIAKHIEKNGEGIQHVALFVDDLTAALEELKEALTFLELSTIDAHPDSCCLRVFLKSLISE